MGDSPTNDPAEIADRYATVTRKMVTDAAQVAIDAFTKINDAPNDGTRHYTADDAIQSMTKLAGIAITGAAALARIPLQTRPINGPMLIADQVASVVERAAADAAAVAGDAAEKIQAGTFRQGWVDSAVTLTGMATLRAAEIAEALAAGPGDLADPRMRFGPYEIDTANTTDELVLKIDTLARPGVDENIADLVCFEPPSGVVKAGAPRKFSLLIDSSGVSSGIFRGTVRVYKKGADRSYRNIPIILNL